MHRLILILILVAGMALASCNQQTCPANSNNGRGGPIGDGGNSNQKLFNKDVR